MIADVVCAFITAIVFLVGIALQPTRAMCPPDWYAEGVRPSGSFTCHRWTRDNVERDAPMLPGEIGMKVWCTNGTVPVLRDDGRTVGCMRYPGT